MSASAGWQRGRSPPIKTVTQKLHHSQSTLVSATTARDARVRGICRPARPTRKHLALPPAGARRRMSAAVAAPPSEVRRRKREAGNFFSTSSQRAGRFFFRVLYSRTFDHGCRDSKSSTPSARGPNPERCARLRRRRQRSVVPPPPAAACSASRAPGSSYRVFKRPEACRLVGTRRGAAGLSARFENDTVDLARTPKETSL